MLSYAHCVREDPVRRGLLYLGHGERHATSRSTTARTGSRCRSNLPHAPVYWLVVQEHFNDLVIGTYGRGFWILDDITPLRSSTPQVLDADAHLFPPRAGVPVPRHHRRSRTRPKIRQWDRTRPTGHRSTTT